MGSGDGKPSGKEPGRPVPGTLFLGRLKGFSIRRYLTRPRWTPPPAGRGKRELGLWAPGGLGLEHRPCHPPTRASDFACHSLGFLPPL